jgi:hypothetical protein
MEQAAIEAAEAGTAANGLNASPIAQSKARRCLITRPM